MVELTVIIPSYNMQEGAVRAISSVLAQDLPVRVLLVDDCSQPAIELPDEMAANGAVRIIRHKARKGASGARNTGIVACDTPWLGFLDSDDVLLPGTLKARFDFARSSLENGALEAGKTLFGCGWLEPGGSGHAGRIRTPRGASTPEEFASGCWYNPGSCILARRDVYENRLFDEGLKRLEDMQWGLDFGLSGGQFIVGGPAGVEVQPSNRTNVGAVQQSAAAILLARKDLKAEHPKVWRALNAYLNVEIATFAARDRLVFKAAWHLLQSWIWWPRMQRHLSPGWDYDSVTE